MLEEILREIKEMEYPQEDTCTGIGLAAASGFDTAKEQAIAVIRRHMGDDGWIPCGEGFPENEREVEITYTWKHPDGRNFYDTARAFHTDGTMTTEESGYEWDSDFTESWEYNKEKDVPYIPEGWWECVAFGETFSAVDQKVIAWRERPAPYRPRQKAVGEDYKQRVMERFMKVE